MLRVASASINRAWLVYHNYDRQLLFDFASWLSVNPLTKKYARSCGAIGSGSVCVSSPGTDTTGRRNVHAPWAGGRVLSSGATGYNKAEVSSALHVSVVCRCAYNVNPAAVECREKRPKEKRNTSTVQCFFGGIRIAAGCHQDCWTRALSHVVEDDTDSMPGSRQPSRISSRHRHSSGLLSLSF